MKLAVVRRTTGLAAALALSFPLITFGQANNTWMGTGPDLNWSSPANWSFGVAPVGTDLLYFEDQVFLTGYTNATGVVNNVVDSSLSVSAVNYVAASTGTNAHFYTTLI